MHKLTDDRMKWGWSALLAGMALGGIRLATELAGSLKPHPVRTRAEAVVFARSVFHREVCATHCFSHPLDGVWVVPLLIRDGRGQPHRHRWVWVNAQTGRSGTGVCVYEAQPPAGCRPETDLVKVTPAGGRTSPRQSDSDNR
jgi:hypothetical protein